MSLRVFLKSDYPAIELSHECSGDTTIEALGGVLAEAGLASADTYVTVRAVRLGADVIEVEELTQTLSELEIQTNSTLIFFAPPELKPSRNLSKKEIEKEEKEAKKSASSGFGKYAAFNHGNCFTKLHGKSKKEAVLALEYIESEATHLFNSAKNSGFLKLTPSEMVSILKADRLNIKEGKLFAAMQEYAAVHKKVDMQVIYSNIRFPTMDVSDVAGLVAGSGVLDAKQLLSLFTHTALPPNSRPSSLAGFSKKQCEKRNPRFIGCIFDQKGTNVTFSEDKRTASYTGSNNFQGSCTMTACTKYSFKILGCCNNLMAGFTTSAHNLEGNNYASSTGYYFYLNGNGTLYGKGKSGSSYSEGPQSVATIGNVITCQWNKEDKTIEFFVNGTSKGVAYTDVQEEDLLPALDWYDSGSSVMLCDHPSN